MFDKGHIVGEIRRTAKENGGKPLGVRAFRRETGIKESDWRGRYWANWGEALQEVGYSPNLWQGAYDTDFVLEKLAGLAKDCGHFPTHAEINLRTRKGSFPSERVFRRLGPKNVLAAKLAEYCKGRLGYEDVVALCSPVLEQGASVSEKAPLQEEFGFVYLLKSGRYHKIGRSNAVGRRGYELAIQLPDKAAVVHTIKTEDPVGIERYWHKRFEDRHKNGEWFELTALDVSAFKRRKFM